MATCEAFKIHCDIDTEWVECEEINVSCPETIKLTPSFIFHREKLDRFFVVLLVPASHRIAANSLYNQVMDFSPSRLDVANRELRNITEAIFSRYRWKLFRN